MFKRKPLYVILAVILCCSAAGFAQTLEDNWNDFLHYIKIGRLDLAKGYAQAVLASEPDPVKLLALSEANPQGYEILLKVNQVAPDKQLTEFTGKILEIIEKGRFIRRADPKIIAEEVRRLSTTARGRLAGLKRLQNAGEYAIPFMLDALADNSRKEEWPNIIWALPKIGKDAIRPLVAALQTKNVAVKTEIIKALGNIGYPQSLAYLKYEVENPTSAELTDQARQSIKQIDPGAVKVPAAQLFFHLAENYYYQAQSLQPVEEADFANIWFWDAANAHLVKHKVDRKYFNQLMSMRSCEWALRADEGFGQAIGLWLAAFFKAEATGLNMPDYFGQGHADAMTYATTAGPEYLHQALARAIKDKNTYVALGAVEALAATAGESSLLYRLGLAQPLIQALSSKDKAVRYSAAIAIAAAGPKQDFPESKLVIANLAQALAESDEGTSENTTLANPWVTESYALRAVKVMLKSAQTRNPIVDVSAAKEALINATKDTRPQIQILATKTLAWINSPDAQRAIATIAIEQSNTLQIRISAFDSLAVSAKLNGNLLDDERVDAIYSLVGSKQADPQLRARAASAYGALNLPSRKVKDLILDQARL